MEKKTQRRGTGSKLAAFVAALSLVFGVATPALAAVVTGSADHTGNFASDCPIGTITINTADMSPSNPNMTFSSTNPNIVLDTTTTRQLPASIVYAPNGIGDEHKDDVSIPAGSDLTLPGEVTLTWPGIATLQDGSVGDVTMTISNIHFTKPLEYKGTGSARQYQDGDARGPVGIFWQNPNNLRTFIGPKFTSANPDGWSAIIGMDCTINVKITQDGSPVAGTVLFSTNDLDVGGGPYGDDYKEGFDVVGGTVSDIYIPTDSSLDVQSDTKLASKPKTNDNTYEAGFVVLADAQQGITLKWYGQGNSMGTSLFTGNISHHIDSTTGTGGSIKTTTSGKVGEGDELGPIRAEVPDGKDVSYLMEPDPGYKLDKITVDGQEIDPDDSSTWPDFIEVTKDANGNPIVTFKDNAANHTIDVQWQKVWTVTFEDGDHGTSTGGNQTDVPDGDNPEGGNTVTPEDGYEFTGTYKYVITDEDGNVVGEGETDDPTSIPVTGNITFTPVYDPIVTATSGTGGAISDPGDTTVESGSSKTYTFTPEPGYTVGTVTVNGQEVTPVDNGDGTWSYTLENVTEPTTIDVQWKKTYTVTYTDGDNGKSDGAGDQTGVPSGEKVAGGNTVTPNDGYRFTGKYKYVITHDDGTTEEGETDDPTSVTVTGDVVFTPVYQKVITVTYVDPATGRIIQDTVTIDEGADEPAAPADPKRDGYFFKGWKRTVDEHGNIVYEAIWGRTPIPLLMPRTGDPTSFIPMITLAGTAAAAVAGGVAMKRRKHSGKHMK